MKKQIKKVLSVFCVLALLLCLSACGQEGQVVKPYLFNPNLKTYNIISTVAAENEKYELKWDSDNKRVLLVDKSDGYVYSNIPNDMLESEIEDTESDGMLKLMSGITVDCIRTETHEKKSGYGIDCINDGDFSVRKIDNGLRVTYVFRNLKLSVPVQYLLFDDGLKIRIDPKDIAENGKNHFLHTIAVAPFFCSAKNMSEDSYLFYPSGSGVLIRMNQQKHISVNYSEDIYGMDGMNDIKTWCKETNTEEIHLPVFGAKNGDHGVFAIINSASESGTMIVDAYNENIGYSAVYTEFAVRGETNVSNKFLQSAENSMKYADYFAQTPIEIDYYPLKGDNANYSGMAEIYRNYLKDHGMKKTKSTGDLSVKILGGAMIDTNILGIPSRKFFATSTLNEAENIMKDIKNSTKSNLYVDLVGFGESGIETGKIAGGFTVNGKLGGVKSLKELVKQSEKDGNTIFYDFDIIGISKSGCGYSPKSDVAVSPILQRSGFTDYALSTNNSSGTAYYYIARSKLLEVANKMLKKANAWNLGGVALDSLSNVSYSDYHNQKYYSRGNTQKDVASVINKSKKQGLIVMTNAANDYAAKLSNVILDVPIQSSKADLFSDEIPFYEMVFRGYIPMYSPSLNLSNDEQIMLLKSVEAGNGLSYTVMNNFNGALRKEFDFYHNTLYSDLKETIITDYEKVKDYLNTVKDCEITEHKITSKDLHCTEFSNGVSVYVNFGYKDAECPIGTVKPYSFVYSGLSSKE